MKQTLRILSFMFSLILGGFMVAGLQKHHQSKAFGLPDEGQDAQKANIINFIGFLSF